MRRRLFTIVSVLSLLALLATAALWMHSFQTWDILRHRAIWTADGDLTIRGWGLESNRGSLIFDWEQWLVAGLYNNRQGWERLRRPPTPPRTRKESLFYFDVELAGWRSSENDSPDDHQMRTILVVVPYAGLAVAFAIISLAFGWRAWALYKRSRIGGCPACGYDLTGNISGVCPECGTLVTKGAK